MSAWICLGLAIVFEVAGTLALKLSDGFEKPLLGMLAIGLYTACFWVFAPALKVIPVGVAYALWAGVGIVAAAMIGLLVFGERLSTLQVVFMAMVLAGAAGLRLTTAAA